MTFSQLMNRFLIIAGLIAMLAGCGSSSSGSTPIYIATTPATTTTTTPASTYLVEYIPGTTTTTGKTTFTIRVRTRSTGAAANTLTLTLDPIMHMTGGMTHSTPIDSIMNNGDGTYTCTAYYLMSDHMMGSAVGYWELQVAIGSETASFYPSVGMGMREITKAWGPSDSMMNPADPDKYSLFNDSAAANSIAFFIAHSEDMKMKFVAASNGAVMASPTGAVNDMTVDISVDDATFASPVSAASNTAGHWSAANLNKSVGGANKIYIRMKVNTQDKTKTGMAWDGATNSAAAFNVMIN